MASLKNLIVTCALLCSQEWPSLVSKARKMQKNEIQTTPGFWIPETFSQQNRTTRVDLLSDIAESGLVRRCFSACQTDCSCAKGLGKIPDFGSELLLLVLATVFLVAWRGLFVF